MKPDIKLCAYCHEPVFEQFWQGEKMVREMSKVIGEVGDGPHTCSLNLHDVETREHVHDK